MHCTARRFIDQSNTSHSTLNKIIDIDIEYRWSDFLKVLNMALPMVPFIVYCTLVKNIVLELVAII